MDFFSEIINYSINVSRDIRINNRHIFLFPYYCYINNRICDIISNKKNIFRTEVIEQLTYQIVSYAYEKYFKFVYPYEYKLANENGLLEGSTDEERNRYFLKNLSAQEEWIKYCFEKYPKLRIMLEIYSEGILAHLNEFLSSISKDYQQLSLYFCIDDSLIDKVCVFEGDLHYDRCVSSISFQNGKKLYYKPRRSSNEKFLLDIVSFLKEIGMFINIGIPQFLDKGTYSWHLHVNTKEMSSKELINEYYNNLGKVQGLCYLLGIQDIIPDNILCVDNCPYIIDCEAIISKTFKHLDSSKLSLYLQESVLQTGILPDWMFNAANERTQISSVLFEFGTENHHLPKIDGKSYPITEETLEDFKSGFKNVCNFFRIHNEEIKKFITEYKTSSLSSRVLLHPTVIYSLILEEMVTPPYLHGQKNIKDLVEPIVRFESYGALRDTLISSIVIQIESGNIPYFYTRTSETALYMLPNKKIINDWTPSDTNGMFPIIKKLSQLTPKRQQEQLYIIEETINFFIDVTHGSSNKERIRPTGNDRLEPQKILDAAERIGTEIHKRMIEIDNEIGFVCRTKNIYDGKFQVCLMNDSLYDGMLGVCLFYQTLYTYCHHPKYKIIAEQLFEQLCDNRHKSYNGIDDSTIPISPLSGITGLLYIMERFPEYYNSSVYLSIVEKVEKIIPVTIQYDYMSGLAGLTLFIVQCQLLEERRKRHILKICGERILQLAKTEEGKTFWSYIDGNKIIGERKMILGGFAHGSSSMALALFQLYKSLKDKRFYDMFIQALHHDRSFYSEKIKGWIDGREPSSLHDSGSWCHGATGIALSRLILNSMGYEDSLIAKEFLVALDQIEKRIGYNSCVCHGSMGNLEVLLSILNRNNVLTSRGVKWINSIANEINSRKDVICGDDNRNSQVGLFMGFAGIGYQLLRFFDWENVPSILFLEVTPITNLLHKK